MIKNKKLKNFLLIFIFANILFIILIYNIPIFKFFILSFFVEDNILFTYLAEIFNNNKTLKNDVLIDMTYLLLKNNITDSALKYINLIDFNLLNNYDKSSILNYFGYIHLKKNELEKSREKLIEACKINPNNFIIINNLNYILKLIEKENQKSQSGEKTNNITEIIEIQNLINISNAENQIIKSKIEKNKDNRNNRFW